MWLPKTSSAGLQYRYWRAFANQLVPELTDEPAWPTLRAHLLLLAGDGADPHQRLRAAYDVKEISSADDRAAVLDWRLDDTSLLSGGAGPLSWLPGIPDRIAAKPTWGPYLEARSDLVAQLAGQVRLNVGGEAPAWAAQLRALVSAELIADIRVWRAASQVDPADLRPTGPPSSAAPPESSNSDSTYASPPRIPTQTGIGGSCSPQKCLTPPQTHFCRNWQKD